MGPRQLEDAVREVLILVGAEGFSYEEAAEMIGVRVGTVKSRASRARTRLAELLGAISVVGLLEQLNGWGLLFGKVQADFRVVPGAIEVSRGSAVGASLGVSGEGVYRTETTEIDMQGTISPIYLLNGIGQIFSRRGEGLFGFNYRLTGPASAIRVSVNPLSILTPGMFREIFRADPPRADQ